MNSDQLRAMRALIEARCLADLAAALCVIVQILRQAPQMSIGLVRSAA